jgi:putative hydrolase of the HAD superfamily
VIELVVFDMDGVLADLDRARRLELLAGMTGHTPAFLQAAIWDSGFEAGAERGRFATGDEYLAEWNWRAKCHLTRAQWVRARREAMTLRPEVLQLAQAATSHCGIAMLTNNGPLLYEELPEILPEVFRIFGSRAHASFQFEAAKPEPEVFERLARRYDVKPGSAVAVDDNPAYVAGARAAGLHGIDYAGPAALRQRLLALGLRLEG